MIKTMPYWLYKKGYSEFPAENYNSGKKTIDVTLPDYKAPSFPKEWQKDGAAKQIVAKRYQITVYSYNSGLAENYMIEYGYEPGRFGYFDKHGRKYIGAGLYARQKCIDFVKNLIDEIG
jgi:hypothetical protein